MDANSQPIIVKKVKKGGHGGHHGGSWKVAYADFVTAMMAFFLLLWLLNTTDQEEKAGISDYFQAPAGLIEGRGASDSTVDLGGVQNAPRSREGEEFRVEVQQFERDGQEGPVDSTTATAMAAARELERLESLKAEIEALIEANEALKPYQEQLLLDITAEGLRIQVVDRENRTMFASGSAELQDYTQVILRALGETIDTVPNRISLTGHTDAAPFASQRRGYGNWELSADRANASRRQLVAGGLREEKIAKVVGVADNIPFNEEDPLDPINRRIAIIVMNQVAEANLAGEHRRVESEDEAATLLQEGAGAGGTEVDPPAPTAPSD